MKRFLQYIALLPLMAMMVACSDTEQQVTEAAPQTVAIVTVEGGLATRFGKRHYVGRVEPVSTVDISFQVSGNMNQLPVIEGSVIPKGALLAALDPVDFKAAVKEAELAAEVAYNEYMRKKTLLDKQLVAPEAFEQAESQYKLRKVTLDNALRNLSYTEIQAPFAALVTRRLIDAHTNVQAREAVLRIQDVSEVRITISVPEELMRLSVEPDALDIQAVVTMGGTEKRFPLQYREHSTEADPVAQSYKATLGMPNPEGMNLLPGMTVTVVVTPKSSLSDTLVFVPVGAIDTSGSADNRVWIYDAATGTVSARVVEVGAIMSGNITVKSGLQDGDQIVVAGVSMLRSGMKVQPLGNLR